ncbi:leucine-rich melanocyte differentiation-associated protein-like [Venturia canescens]|uniref:leucine-rich melanocyte differentiation-associated protein-like n=1 Tax=Venturia canescens TaxID=32260 RepID=UPI001C9D3029|nr:leucine-rich melanocyte differentiation-associated protein-like [Venturia canescens]XP_043289024.1 leucine-rich melanocyte differentiation-associated protein-like [Venturia canescens]
MAGVKEQDFNRSALTVENKQAWYTGQRAERIPSGLVRVVGNDCVSLDLSYNELTSISSVEDYVNLQQLIIDNNKLRDLKTLPKMPRLTTLSLNNNKVIDIDEALERIKECCPSIEYVSLLGNPGYPDQLTANAGTDEADYERYRLYAIHTLPSTLRFLDSRRITQQEMMDARCRGRLLRTVKLAPLKITELTETGFDEVDTILDVNYTPLPSSRRNPQDHKGAYGKCRYRYSGKNSEGNRFICNNDL